MPLMLRGVIYSFCLGVSALTRDSPLKPAEIQVLRSQYEKEGDYVGIQTKFNYAWVGLLSISFDLIS